MDGKELSGGDDEDDDAGRKMIRLMLMTPRMTMMTMSAAVGKGGCQGVVWWAAIKPSLFALPPFVKISSCNSFLLLSIQQVDLYLLFLLIHVKCTSF